MQRVSSPDPLVTVKRSDLSKVRYIVGGGVVLKGGEKQ